MIALRETFAHWFHPRFSNNHRPRLLQPEGLAVLCLIAVFAVGLIQVLERFPIQSGRVLGYSSEISIDKVISLTNQERQRQGLPTLTYSQQLSVAAAAKADDMFKHQYWAHYSPTGKAPWDFMKAVDYRYSVAGENLARDFQANDDLMFAWMNSPTHRDNIVNPKYQEIGVAVANGKLNGVETTLVVQMFGTLSNSAVVAQVDGGATTAKKTAVEPSVQVEPVRESNVSEVTPEVASESFTNQTQRIQPVEVAQQPFIAELASASRYDARSHLSPLQLSKAVFLAITMLVMTVLVYDTVVISDMGTVRFVGKNAAHFLLFLVIFFLVLLFKGGVIL